MDSCWQITWLRIWKSSQCIKCFNPWHPQHLQTAIFLKLSQTRSSTNCMMTVCAAMFYVYMHDHSQSTCSWKQGDNMYSFPLLLYVQQYLWLKEQGWNSKKARILKSLIFTKWTRTFTWTLMIVYLFYCQFFMLWLEMYLDRSTRIR